MQYSFVFTTIAANTYSFILECWKPMWVIRVFVCVYVYVIQEILWHSGLNDKEENVIYVAQH